MIPAAMPAGGSGINPFLMGAIKYWVDAGKITGVADGGSLAASDVVDQSASAHGALTARVNLTYRANAGNGKPAIEFNGVDSYGRSPSFAVAQALTVFAVIKQITWVNGTRFWDGNSVNAVVFNQNTITPTTGMYAGSSAPIEAITDLGRVTLMECLYSGASSTIQSNGNVVTTGSSGTNGFTDGVCFGVAGGLNAGFFCNYQLLEWMVADSTLTGAQNTQIRAYLTAKHSLITRYVVVYDGNSLTGGTGASNPQIDGSGTDYPSQCLALLGGLAHCRHFNFGVSGQTTPDMTADAAAQVDPQVKTFARAIVVAWEVSNDIVVNGASAVDAYNHMVTYCSGRRSAGFKVIVLTVIARINFTAPMIVIKDAVNANIRANWATFSDAICDVAADVRLQNFADTTYFDVDGIHLNDTGYAVVASLVAATIATIS